MHYKLVGLDIDLQEEFEGFTEEDEKGFALIEFKITAQS